LFLGRGFCFQVPHECELALFKAHKCYIRLSFTFSIHFLNYMAELKFSYKSKSYNTWNNNVIWEKGCYVPGVVATANWVKLELALRWKPYNTMRNQEKIMKMWGDALWLKTIKFFATFLAQIGAQLLFLSISSWICSNNSSRQWFLVN
jgi:hypothetical protein